MAGRPRSFDRDDALARATEAFWRDGYEETSISALVREIGITPPSLYAAFGDKATLFREAADGYVAHMRAEVDVCLAEPTARGAVQRLLLAAARAHTDPATPPGCFVCAEPRLAAEREWPRRRVAERLARAQADGDLPADADPNALADFVELVTEGMSQRARRGATAAELESVARLAAAAVPAPAAVAAR